MAGGRPELHWPSTPIIKNEGALRDFLKLCGGVLLPGGADIEPIRYGENRHPKLGPTNFDLDEGQLAIVRILLKESIPTLAICRGLQVVAVAAGAKLYQDLPSQYQSKIRVNHRIAQPKDALAHWVHVADGSRLSKICGATRFEVNSRHHQAVREGSVADMIGPFKIVAHASDGVIEGLELCGHPFFVAVQWHPENLVDGHSPSQNLFRAFLRASGGTER